MSMSPPVPGAGPAPRPSVRPFSAGRALGGAAAFGAIGATLSGVYAATGHGLFCPFKLFTGWDCPFCGGTRLGAALLHLDLAAAFVYNPVIFVGLGLLALLGAAWVVEVLGGPRLRLPRRLRSRLLQVHPTVWTVVVLAAALLYTLARHLWFPVPA